MSGMTACEKILARSSGREMVQAGEIVDAVPDLAMSHDNTYLVYQHFREIGAERIIRPDRVVIVLDHRAPANNVSAANAQKAVRGLQSALGIERFFDVGTGICHQLLVEGGLVRPGMLVVGTDSHSTTYGSVGAIGVGIGAADMTSVWTRGSIWLRVPETLPVVLEGMPPASVFAKDIALMMVGRLGSMGADYCCIEFRGDYLSRATLSDRMTLCNMTAETGAKSAIVLEGEAISAGCRPDDDASYREAVELDLTNAEPLVSVPHSVDDVRPVGELEGIAVDQAFLGSCTNGRLEDLDVAARVIGDGSVKDGVRLIVAPASSKVLLEATRAGIIEKLVLAGAVLVNPGCGPCMGAHQGILADGEVCISSSNRNFRGRMGSREASIYLASPATVAASALEGRIADPRRYLG